MYLLLIVIIILRKGFTMRNKEAFEKGSYFFGFCPPPSFSIPEHNIIRGADEKKISILPGWISATWL